MESSPSPVTVCVTFSKLLASRAEAGLEEVFWEVGGVAASGNGNNCPTETQTKEGSLDCSCSVRLHLPWLPDWNALGISCVHVYKNYLLPTHFVHYA